MELYEKNVLAFGKQLGFTGLTAAHLEKLEGKKSDAVFISGLGGSGLPQNIMIALGPTIGLKKPILGWKDYGLNPARQFFKNPLFIFVSFSGNTAETISGLKEALAEKLPLAVITTGGRMKNIAEQFRLPLVTYSGRDLTPREALGYNYFALIKILRSVFPKIKSRILSEKIKTAGLQNAAKNLAKKIGPRIVLVYTDNTHAHLGYVWKTNLNETAKRAAFTNTIPEFLHNEITAFESKHYPFFAVFLTDPAAPKVIRKKTEAAHRILKAVSTPGTILKLQGKTQEEKTWNSIVLSHLTSFYLAQQNKINPRKTRLIDQLKKLTK